ncbi:hypothetical protein GCM10010341_65120 [Streptomyces noursei]|nr:hypothetical protein GCM10010341_65120 [Streptomyces noursei]
MPERLGGIRSPTCSGILIAGTLGGTTEGSSTVSATGARVWLAPGQTVSRMTPVSRAGVISAGRRPRPSPGPCRPRGRTGYYELVGPGLAEGVEEEALTANACLTSSHTSLTLERTGARENL